MLRVTIGADTYGFELKDAITTYLKQQGEITLEDVGIYQSSSPDPYYRIASEVAARVSDGKADRGILVCGTGMGMGIIANKHVGVFAAVCENSQAAQRSRAINNSNVLSLGGLVTSVEKAKEIVDVWLATKFTEGFEEKVQDWLKETMPDIANLEKERFRQRQD